ncbi:hypothetical protein [Vibrio metschnikovii]|uniref:Lipoprotein n=1 Tax=Vibrio metschnikovii TaxID=28172 RepID=A0A9X0RB20_VIBME|nr:hypothetical protein [Vibrio metschnikovii]MBC5853087.1 hypothetical protein [Vibrio metschnikovii]
MINMNLKLLIMAYIAGMSCSFAVSIAVYYFKPFEITKSLVFTILFVGGAAMTLLALKGLKKDKYLGLAKQDNK